ncbi:MAG: hypothetical protein DRO11_04360 [Methanobacteriota archaeon]|nr:MAG: hypothetical protein DRO11_04360 [Euryarchaeota archaeon]
MFRILDTPKMFFIFFLTLEHGIGFRGVPTIIFFLGLGYFLNLFKCKHADPRETKISSPTLDRR